MCEGKKDSVFRKVLIMSRIAFCRTSYATLQRRNVGQKDCHYRRKKKTCESTIRMSMSMSSESQYEIQRTPERGATLVATANILPGSAIIKDSPILYFTDEFFNRFAAYNDMSVLLAGYAAYMLLPSAEQTRFMTLFGPTTGPKADLLRTAARQTFGDCEDHVVEQFVRVASIVRLNIFAIDGGYAVYDLLTRMSHSCIPNCKVNFEGNVAVCRTILRIKAGDELTIEYVSDHRLKPTYARRFNYALKKEFTCTCTRCMGPGDDTRQFPCSDNTCTGRHFACQPLTHETERGQHCIYDGVDYVEPHLLPCTVCNKSPTLEYQEEMFTVEVTLPELEQRFLTEASTQPRTVANNLRLIQQIEAEPFPRTHCDAAPILRLLVILHGQLTTTLPTYEVGHLFDAVSKYVKVVTSVAAFPSSTVITPLFEMAQILYNTDRPIVYGLAVEFARQAICTQLIAFGRHARIRNLDALLGDLLEKLPASSPTSHALATMTGATIATVDAVSTTRCSFCEESPQFAALTLSRCGRCLQAAYCSADCQKAHWKIHKKYCRGPRTRSGSG